MRVDVDLDKLVELYTEINNLFLNTTQSTLTRLFKGKDDSKLFTQRQIKLKKIAVELMGRDGERLNSSKSIATPFWITKEEVDELIGNKRGEKNE